MGALAAFIEQLSPDHFHRSPSTFAAEVHRGPLHTTGPLLPDLRDHFQRSPDHFTPEPELLLRGPPKLCLIHHPGARRGRDDDVHQVERAPVLAALRTARIPRPPRPVLPLDVDGPVPVHFDDPADPHLPLPNTPIRVRLRHASATPTSLPVLLFPPLRRSRPARPTLPRLLAAMRPLSRDTHQHAPVRFDVAPDQIIGVDPVEPEEEPPVR
mmetsp:Transcript_46487/g.110626  ORF Transcript_46487/g.110626 Transcript_46487/m.110626 type:complete len:212 (+) Transcript_46487:175-810(+)